MPNSQNRNLFVFLSLGIRILFVIGTWEFEIVLGRRVNLLPVGHHCSRYQIKKRYGRQKNLIESKGSLLMKDIPLKVIACVRQIETFVADGKIRHNLPQDSKRKTGPIME